MQTHYHFPVTPQPHLTTSTQLVVIERTPATAKPKCLFFNRTSNRNESADIGEVWNATHGVGEDFHCECDSVTVTVRCKRLCIDQNGIKTFFFIFDS